MVLADGKLDEALSRSPEARETGPEAAEIHVLLPQPDEPGQPSGALLELIQLADPEADPGEDGEAWHLPPPGIHTTGSQLRRRLVTPESIAELAAHRKPSLLQRILRRK